MDTNEYSETLKFRIRKGWSLFEHEIDVTVEEWFEPLNIAGLTSDEELIEAGYDLIEEEESDLLDLIRGILYNVPVRNAGPLVMHWMKSGMIYPQLAYSHGIDVFDAMFEEVERNCAHSETAAREIAGWGQPEIFERAKLALFNDELPPNVRARFPYYFACMFRDYPFVSLESLDLVKRAMQLPWTATERDRIQVELDMAFGDLYASTLPWKPALEAFFDPESQADARELVVDLFHQRLKKRKARWRKDYGHSYREGENITNPRYKYIWPSPFTDEEFEIGYANELER
jgi:hypothetical protein